MSCGAVAYVFLLIGFWEAARHSALLATLGSKLPYAFASFALLLAPLWFFGFGAAEWIRVRVKSVTIRVLLSALLALPYFVFAVSSGLLRWKFAAAMLVVPVIMAALLRSSALQEKLAWQDVVVLALIAAAHISKWLAPAWPYPGLAFLPKLYLIDVALYLYLVVRGLGGMGYSLIPWRASFAAGLRGFCYFLLLGLGLGAATHFIHLHRHIPSGLTAAGTVVVTFLLVAIPEEIFFRAILQNLLETRIGRTRSLLVASVLFGLGHFNKGAVFNWRYVVLAAIAGVFYGRAWRAQRQVLASAITHTAVDVVWSLWFR
ncbi:MAG TPA: CPBP family intramembrane glutamic endopeptidase [Terriglobales bacterium]|nr:CPBP family intramembrane glutamic endopeptidase [Terriglobales bacterium]